MTAAECFFALIDDDATSLETRDPPPEDLIAPRLDDSYRAKRQKMDDHGSVGRKSLRKSQGFGIQPPVSPPQLRASRSVGSFPAAIASRNPLEPKMPGFKAPVDASRGTESSPAATGPVNGNVQPAGGHAGNAQKGAAQASHSESNTETIEGIMDRLQTLRHEMGQQSADRAVFAIRETTAAIKDQRVHIGRDLFAKSESTLAPSEQPDSMKITFKQHGRHNKVNSPAAHHVPIPIQSSKERVPRYKYHHIEIEKNIKTAGSSHSFVPHVRDVHEAEEKIYDVWVQELYDNDKKMGKVIMTPEQKRVVVSQSEKAASVSMYLEYWLQELAIPGCTMDSLDRLVGDGASDDDSSTQEPSPSDPGGPLPKESRESTERFIEAFRKVFTDSSVDKRANLLRQVLRYCRSTDNDMDTKLTAKDDLTHKSEDEDEQAEDVLSSYSIFGCQICHQHSCEHPDYDEIGQKMYNSAKLTDLLKKRRSKRGDIALVANRDLERPCEHEVSPSAHCPPNGMAVLASPWTEDQRETARSLWVTLLEFDEFKDSPRCEIASWLNRPCREVREELRKMHISVPAASPPSMHTPKPLLWYDRYKKTLSGNWADHLKVHEYSIRDTVDPCKHKGPCKKGSCKCIDKGLLCEKLCGCTLDCCSYKFNGCACHARGKNCLANQKDKGCVCALLNRECDPSLCGSCGIKEDAFPRLPGDGDAPRPKRRCQNSDLQVARPKDVVLGRSQLQGVGFGLYTAEPIAQDEFVLEYTGEAIPQDEGERRAHRQGLADNEPSFAFTLLENEGTWIDAAMYGNLSRYINHAPKKDKWSCNIGPKILYVNGEFRIKFVALRNIAIGEELFFNYGENFPNLTQKLLDDTPHVKKTTKRKSRGPQQHDGSPKRPRGRPMRQNGPQANPASARRPRGSTDEDNASDAEEDEEPEEILPVATRKRKRAALEDSSQEDFIPNGKAASSDDEEYRGTKVDDDGSPATAARLRARRKQRKIAKPTAPKPAVVKVKGKRGGARPGSGRPRKHPLPVPKENGAAAKGTPTATPTKATAAPAAAAKEVAAEPSPAPSTPEPRPTLRAHKQTTRYVGHLAQRDQTRLSRQTVPDSEEEESQLGRGGNHEEEEEERDEEEDDDDDDDDEVIQRLRIRKGTARARRQRKMPARYSADQVYLGRSPSQ